MDAQINTAVGEYYLTGVMETASGFKLNSDSTFEFFFSYGALDRYGSGTWKMNNNTITFNSKPYPGHDFKMTSSENTKDNFTTVQIDASNANFFRFVYCLLKTKEGDSLLNANSDGIITLPGRNYDSLHLLFYLAPERTTTIPINNKEKNNFTFTFEPWIVEVFFKDFVLNFKDDHLEGKHPLLEKELYIYKKN